MYNPITSISVLRAVILVAVLIACSLWTVSGIQVENTPYGSLRETVSDHMCLEGLKQTTGYFSIDPSTNKEYFYWFFPAQRNSATAPVVLWLTGGPGCSGELALFAENGPCTFNSNGVLSVNPYSWNINANLIYVDQPAGTGFSTSERDGYDTNEVDVARDLNAFLRTFFTKHSEYAQNEFYIFGESYGGHYAPATASYVNTQNKKGKTPSIHLVGVGVGNGLTNPTIQYQYYPEMIYNYTDMKLGSPLVDISVYENMKAELPDCIKFIEKCNDPSSSDHGACQQAMNTCNDTVMGPYVVTNRNPYDIRIPCEHPPLCYDFSPVTAYLNDPKVQARIGVNMKWETCNMIVNQGFINDFMRSYSSAVPELLQDDIRVMIYAGDCDYICNWIGNLHWTLAMNWKGQEDFHNQSDKPWRIPGVKDPIATIRSSSGLSFVKVLNAGHMVPLDQPRAALEILDWFLGVSKSSS